MRLAIVSYSKIEQIRLQEPEDVITPLVMGGKMYLNPNIIECYPHLTGILSNCEIVDIEYPHEVEDEID